MADTTAEVVHQHYANSTAAIAAMNAKNWAFEEAGDRLIIMDGATPRYFDTTVNLLASNNWILNQTASAQSGGFNVSGAGIVGGTLTVAGIADFATTLSVTGLLTASASVVVGSGLQVGALAGTGTRIATSTSTGVLGNATTIAGNYTLSGTQTIGTGLTLSYMAASRIPYTGASLDLTSTSNLTYTPGTTTFATANATLSGNLTISSLSSGRIPIVSTAGLIIQDNLYWDATNDRVGVGSAASSPSAVGAFYGGSGASAGIVLATNNTNATNKEGRIKAAHYTNAEEPVTMAFLSSTSSASTLNIGGNSSLENAVTQLDFYTAANNTTVSGTRRGGFNSSGVFDIVGAMTGAASTWSGLLTASASLTMTGVGTFNLTDNTSNAFRVVQGSDNYVQIYTTNGAELAAFGSQMATCSTSLIGGSSVELSSSGDIYASGYFKFNESIRLDGYISAGALSTSAGSPTTITSTGHNSYTFSTNNGAAGYCTISGPDSGRIMFVRNRSSQQLYITNGGNAVNALANGANAILVGNGSTWDVYSSAS